MQGVRGAGGRIPFWRIHLRRLQGTSVTYVSLSRHFINYKLHEIWISPSISNQCLLILWYTDYSSLHTVQVTGRSQSLTVWLLHTLQANCGGCVAKKNHQFVHIVSNEFIILLDETNRSTHRQPTAYLTSQYWHLSQMSAKYKPTCLLAAAYSSAQCTIRAPSLATKLMQTSLVVDRCPRNYIRLDGQWCVFTPFFPWSLAFHKQQPMLPLMLLMTMAGRSLIGSSVEHIHNMFKFTVLAQCTKTHCTLANQTELRSPRDNLLELVDGRLDMVASWDIIM